MKKPIRVLVVEDSEDDAILEVNELRKGGYDPTYERVETPEAMRKALENKKWDCIISDYSMPKFSGLDALHELQKSGIDIPFILVSGTVGEDVAVAAMKAGAHDYIMKGDLKRLTPAIERELRETQIRRERKCAEERLAKLNACLLSFGADPNENINRLVAFCGEQLQAATALYNRLEEDGKLHSLGQWNIPPDFNPVDAPDGHICYDVIQSGRDNVCVIRNLLQTSYAQTDPSVVRYGLRTYIGKAVSFEGAFVGSLCVLYQQDRIPSEDDLNLLGIAATAVGVEEKRKRMMEELRELTTKMSALAKEQRLILEHTRDFVYRHDNQGLFTYVSPAVEQVTGYSVEEFLNTHYAAYLTDNPVNEKVIAYTEETLQMGKESPPYLLEIYHKDGRRVFLEVKEQPYFDAGEVAGVIGVARDITERKKAEEKINLLAHSLKSINECVSITDLTDTFLFVNDAFLKTYGFAEHELIGKNVSIVRSTRNQPEVVQEILPATMSGGWSGELWNRRKDGSEFPISLSTSLVRDNQGQAIALIGVAEDITKRKQAEEDLRRRDVILEAVSFAAERFLKATSWEETIQDVLERLGQATTVSRVYIFENHFAEDGTLLTSQRYEWAAPGVMPQIDNPDVQDFPAVAGGFSRWMEVLGLGQIVHGHVREFPKSEQQVLTPQGIQSIAVVPIFVGQALWGFVGFDECLSERVWSAAEIDALKVAAGTLGAAIQRQQAEEALRQTEEKYRSIFENAVIGIYQTTSDGQFLIANPTLARVLGYQSPQELTTQLTDCGHHFYVEPDRRAEFIRLIREQDTVTDFESQVYCKDGTVIWISEDARALRDADRTLIGFEGTTIDITKRKQAEEERERLTAILEATTDFVGVADANMHVLYLNSAGRAMVGVGPDEDVSSIDFSEYHPEWARRLVYEEGIPTAIREGTWGGETEFLARDGREIPVSQLLIAHKSPDGKVEYISTVARDISERRQAEENLRESEEHYRLLFESNPLPMFVYDIETLRFVAVNDAAVEHYGYARDEFLAMTIKDIRPPEELPRLEANLSGPSQPQERSGPWKHRKKDGTLIDVEIISHEIMFLNRPARLVLANDITDRKQAEENLRKLSSAVEQTADSIFITNKDGIIEYVNPAFEERTGYTKEEAIGQTPRIVKSGEHNEEFYQELWKTLLSGQTFRRVFINKRKNGELYYEEKTITPLKDEQGNVSHFVSAGRDITDRKRAETLLREERDMLNAIMETSVAAVTVLDEDGNIIFANTRAEEILGLDKSSITALTYNAPEWKITDFDGKPFPEDQLPFRTVITSNAPVFDVEHAIEWPNRERRLLSINGAPLRDDAGNITRVVFTVDDITEKKKLEAQSLRAQRMESIGTLAGGIAHDLNNILAPIMMSLEILQRKFTDEKSLKILDTLYSSAKRGADLVKQVLSFARGAEGERAVVQIRHLISEVEKIIEETFPKSINVVTRVPKDLWLVSADSTQIHQVLMNLCVNARDAMPHGGKIEIEANNIILDETYTRMHPDAKPGPYVTLNITDNGTGMPPAVIDRIFEPFFTTKEIGKGTGLGLSTVFAIAKSHNGFVNVYSEVGKGTTFSVYLPAVKSPDIEHAGEKQPIISFGANELVLVVDDEGAIREITKATLESFGYKVITASDGTEALALYAQRKDEIAAVITDMMMPFMDGPATIRALQKMNPQVRILAVSGAADNGYTATSSGSGKVFFLRKPHTAEKLLTSLRQVLDAPLSSEHSS